MNYSNKPGFKSALEFDGSALSVSLAAIAEQQTLLRYVQTQLPPHIAEHAVHCVLSDMRLTVYARSAVWASQIRFFQTEILNKIQASGQRKIAKVRIKVLPPIESASSRSREVILPSADTVSMILNQVDDKSNDVLQVALSKLAGTLSRRVVVEAGRR